jgi:hypothetical protein
MPMGLLVGPLKQQSWGDLRVAPLAFDNRCSRKETGAVLNLIFPAAARNALRPLFVSERRASASCGCKRIPIHLAFGKPG